VLANHAAVLGAVGCDLQHVVRTTVLLKDLDDFGAMNAEYERAFGSHRPARTTYAVADLPRGAKVVIECTAVLRS
jgi:2-iminobutanoate/2-iminopropanoate deaminase